MYYSIHPQNTAKYCYFGVQFRFIIMSLVASNVQKLQAELSETAATVIAVAKTFSAQQVREAANAGIRHFGENYLQEAETKITATADLPLIWHFIGAIQSNKIARIAALFDWVHGVDRLSIGQRLSAARANKTPINIFLQINIDNEANKAGVSAANAPALAYELAKLPNVRLRGLMAIPAATNNTQRQYNAFCKVADLQKIIIKDGKTLDCLSLGMSADYQQALRAGATHIRVGTAIFGKRERKS